MVVLALVSLHAAGFAGLAVRMVADKEHGQAGALVILAAVLGGVGFTGAYFALRNRLGCLVAFAMPVCLLGIVAAFEAMRRSRAGGEAGLAAVPAVTALACGLPVLWVLVAGFRYRIAFPKAAARTPQHSAAPPLAGDMAAAGRAPRRLHFPDAPRKLRKPWAAGRITNTLPEMVVLAWVFGGIFLIPTLTLGGMIGSIFYDQIWKGVPQEGGTPTEGLIAFLILLLTMLGCSAMTLLLLLGARRATRRHREFGASTFEMAFVPGVIGGQLGGIIHTPVNIRPAGGFRVTLQCINHVLGDEAQVMAERVQWKAETLVSAELLPGDTSRSAIPVVFDIPADCPETLIRQGQRKRYFWRLEVTAQGGGVDFASRFHVPVYALDAARMPPAGSRALVFPLRPAPSESTGPAALPSRGAGRRTTGVQAAQPPASKIRMTPLPDGGVEFLYPARRFLGTAVAVSIMALVLVGITLLLALYAIAAARPDIMIVGVLLGAVALSVSAAAVRDLFSVTRVRIVGRQLTVRFRVLGLSSTRTIPLADIAAVRTHLVGRSSKGSSADCYAVRIVTNAGKQRVVGGYLRNRQEAEWIADEMNRARTALASPG